MGLIFFRKANIETRRLGILPGAFNPPTRAHIGLAEAALEHVDEVVFVLPREMPHKDYSGVPFEERAELVMLATAHEPRFSVAASAGGLFLEIAREARESYSAALVFLCGRDAAERIVNWDYGRPGAIAAILEDFEMLVASRQGRYEPPEELKGRIQCMALRARYDDVAATEVRKRIGKDDTWRDLVPEAIADSVHRLYSRRSGTVE